jgi:thiosulfate reductase cytochrome b subunit
MLMTILIVYFFGHMFLMPATGFLNNLNSMTTGWYRLDKHDGVGI